MRIIIIIIGILLCTNYCFAQTRADLEKRRQSIVESIRQTEEQLEATKKDKKATMGQLRALQNKLSERQHLISNINQEIGQIDNTIQLSAKEVGTLRQNLEVLKIRYAQSLRYAYQNRSSYDMLAFLFSSQDFNDALRRIKYLKKYRDYRKDQVEQIHLTQNQIEHKIVVLNSQKTQKDELLSTQLQQKQVLQQETDETNNVVNELKGREKELLTQVEKNKKASRQLDKAISEIIRREIEIARKQAQEEAQRNADRDRRQKEEDARLAAAKNTNPYNTNVKVNTNPATTKPVAGNTNNNATTITSRPRPVADNYSYTMTPEATALSNGFENNHGRLPWPVEKGFISDHFGVHPHPVEHKVMIENMGIDIRTSAGAAVRSVYEGTVGKVFFIPGLNWNVLINHGRYFSIYSHLANISVKAGDKVATKQSIGTIAPNDDGDNLINFQIWKDSGKSAIKLDPETWIAH